MNAFSRFLCQTTFFYLTLQCWAKGELSDNIIIHSQHLAYDLQYRVYQPKNISNIKQLPVVFVTDGQYYIHDLHMPEMLDKLIKSDAMLPVVVVFVDSRNPDKLDENRRNQQFLCNTDYAIFFAEELIPHIESTYSVSKNLKDRLIMGVSFGGINAACFGLLMPKVFNNLAMHSPASNKEVKIIAKLYEDHATLPLKVFLSVGNGNDSTAGVRKFRKVLESKNYNVTYREVPFGHETNNWRRLVDDALLTFFEK